MVYAIRFSNNIEWDIQRGYSCWGAKEARLSDREMSGWDALSEEEIEAAQARWVRTYGEKYDDFETFKADWIEENAYRNAANADVKYVRDEKYGTWAQYHHDGLSCFALTSATVEAAIAEFKASTGFDPMIGDRTVGNIEYVCSFDHAGMTFHLLQCEAAEAEEWLD